MARTRSDFLTRAPILSVGGESEEDDGDNTPLSPRHYTLPLPKQVSPHSVLGESCFSDSEMVMEPGLKAIITTTTTNTTTAAALSLPRLIHPSLLKVDFWIAKLSLLTTSALHG